jgi:uncharacterized damage-inducible protein DinB
MHPEVAATNAILDEQWAEIREIAQAIGPDGLHYVPQQGMNSTSVIVRHVAGSQEWWIGELLGGQPVHRNRDGEFAAADVDLDGVLQQLDESIGTVRQVLDSLAADDLNQTRIYRDQIVTTHWILARVVSHVSVHVGHLQMTRQLWERYCQEQER